jgi:Fe-S-cluster-containing dehydrogenase component/DMSO reductase anchor subunit
MDAVEFESQRDETGAPKCESVLPIVEGDSNRVSGPTLIHQLLEEQKKLSAVEQFSSECHTQSGRYSNLLPATPPGPGQQYAFEVDLDRCSGCKACVTACHSMNGLDETETWRDVGLLIGGSATNPVMQHVTTACHHCLEPACQSACPVDAYEKDPVTGIVKHLDDQCFGCQYCTLACPYDVPKHNREKGIVRKCDLCSTRLAAGEAPACVQACPHEAIAIRLVHVEEVVQNSEVDHFLPAAPDPALTLPTTTYRTKRHFPRNTLPADYHATNPQHPHWPLVIMLVLTQLSVGAFVIGQYLETVLDAELMASFRPLHAANSLFFGLVALSASVFHLGRPLYAFRAVIGLRHSWLSREIVAFGLFAGCATLFAAAHITPLAPFSAAVLGWWVAATGLVGLFCSIMIYVATRKEFWNLTGTGSRFLFTAAVLGLAACWLTILLLDVVSTSPNIHRLTRTVGPMLARALIVVSSCELVWEALFLIHLRDRTNTPLKRSARLMTDPLASPLFARFACGILGGIAMPAFLLDHSGTEDQLRPIVVIMLFVACVAGELLERYLFFAAVAAPRMPGGLRS